MAPNDDFLKEKFEDRNHTIEDLRKLKVEIDVKTNSNLLPENDLTDKTKDIEEPT